MVRKIIAFLVSIIAIWAIKESIYIFTTNDVDISAKRDQLKLASLSISIPLTIIAIWLWRPKPKQDI
ncbi:hypothetical protein [Pedobacter sp.]